jgi:hypothetical protein
VSATPPVFPPPVDARDLGALARALREQMEAVGVEVAGLDDVVAPCASRMQRAKNDAMIARVWREAVTRLVTAANVELRRRGDARKWRPLVAPGEKDVLSAQFWLLDEAGLQAMTREGYRTVGSVLAQGLISLPFAAIAWVLAFVAFRQRTVPSIVAAVVAYAAWLGVRAWMRARAKRA